VRILHVIHTFPPFSRAGSENYAEALAREQARRHDVRVFHSISDPSRPEYDLSEGVNEGIRIFRVNRTFQDLQDFRETYRSDAVARVFSLALDRWTPEVCHFHHVTRLSTTCVQAARERGIPVVFTLHDFWLICPRGQRLRRDLTLCDRHDRADCVRCMAPQLNVRGRAARLRNAARRAEALAGARFPRGLYRKLASWPFRKEGEALEQIHQREQDVRELAALVDCFVAPSAFLRDLYVQSGFPSDRFVISDYGFDLRAWSGASQRNPRGDASLRVAYIGTWIPSKGVHLLVEALRGTDPDEVQGWIYGYAPGYDGFDDYEGHLRQLAAGAKNIHFASAYRPDDLPGILESTDVLVVPSIWYENSPLTIHEAFLAKVPVIASDHGGMAELVRHGVNGLTFRPGSAASLRRAILSLSRDRRLLEKLKAVQTPVKSVATDAARLEAIYREVSHDG